MKGNKETELIVGSKKLLDWCTLFSSLFLALALSPSFCAFLYFFYSHLMRKNRRQTQEGEISTAVSGCEMAKQIVSNKGPFSWIGMTWRWIASERFSFLLPLRIDSFQLVLTVHNERSRNDNKVKEYNLGYRVKTSVFLYFSFFLSCTSHTPLMFSHILILQG